jgi:tRNA A-37 threonylcarbamoyl transferase component Bud32
MSDPAQSSYDALPLPAQLRVNQMCRAYERAWQAGRPPALGPLLDGIAADERMAFLQEVVEALAAEATDDGADGTVAFVTSSSQGGATDAPSQELHLLEEIGRGAMGVVYKASQPELKRQVAVKMILAGEYADEASLQRFRVEAIAAARLEHEGIVRIHDTGSRDGRPYLVMEYVAGGSLKDRLDGTPWPARKAADLVQQLAAIVQAAHDRQIVHRDLKPANILLTKEGRPKITDFGLAKLLDGGPAMSTSGAILGTPSYMAPEQAAGHSKEVGPAADIYALGAILYELLTGRPPFRGATAADTVLQVLQNHPVPPRALNPQTDPNLETVCLKCLNKDPGQRYTSAAALADDLGRWRDGRPILARPSGWADTLLRNLGRQQWVGKAAWGKIAVVLGLATFATHLTFHWLIHTDQPPLAWCLGIGANWAVTAVTFTWYLSPRRYEWTPAEGHLMSLWGGYVMAVVVLWLAIGAPFDRTVLTTFYPGLGVLTGLAYIVQGSVYWGRFYLLGAGHFVLAMLMQFTPDWAALEFGLLQGGSNLAIGWYLLRRPDE